MTPDLLGELSALRGFPSTARELVRVVGLEPAALLIRDWGGRTFPVPLRTRKNAPGERRFEQLAQIVGTLSAGRIVAHWGGQRLDIPNCKEASTERQHGHIRRDYDRLTGSGYSHPEAVWEIGMHAGFTDRAIERGARAARCRRSAAARARGAVLMPSTVPVFTLEQPDGVPASPQAHGKHARSYEAWLRA